VQIADNGERHVADVRTEHGWVIEFQHSYITPEERKSRDSFYKKLVWMVHAARRPTDPAQFVNAFEAGVGVGGSPWIRRVRPDSCRLFKEWSGSPAPIFFDFGPGPTLWWVVARRPDEPMYIAPFSRAEFIAIHHGKGPEGARDFDEFAKTISGIVTPYNAQLRSQPLAPTPSRPPSVMPRRKFRF